MYHKYLKTSLTLLFITILYCFLTRLLSINSILSFGFYIGCFSIIKGITADTMQDVGNMKSIKRDIKANGYFVYIVELVCLILVFLNTMLDGEPLNYQDIIVFILIFGLYFRFMFMNISTQINNKVIKH